MKGSTLEPRPPLKGRRTLQRGCQTMCGITGRDMSHVLACLATRQSLTARQSSPALGDAVVPDSEQFCFGWEVINFEELQ